MLLVERTVVPDPGNAGVGTDTNDDQMPSDMDQRAFFVCLHLRSGMSEAMRET